jgi:hypothetical protein
MNTKDAEQLAVRSFIKDIVRDSISEETDNLITIINSAGRTVQIQFSSDPAIAKKESPTTSHFFNLDAIEVFSTVAGKMFI